MSIRRVVPDVAGADIPSSLDFYQEIPGLETVMDLGRNATTARSG
jgi:catechol 2,3-dioxygenase-like lactoylglutathione lyase family enzyme